MIVIIDGVMRMPVNVVMMVLEVVKRWKLAAEVWAGVMGEGISSDSGKNNTRANDGGAAAAK